MTAIGRDKPRGFSKDGTWLLSVTQIESALKKSALYNRDNSDPKVVLPVVIVPKIIIVVIVNIKTILYLDFNNYLLINTFKKFRIIE